MDHFNFWQRWLVVLSIVIIVFGVFMAIFNQSTIFAFFNQQIDPVFWGSVPKPVEYANFQGWVYGVLGATMAGWGLMLLFIVQNAFRLREKWTWQSIVISLGSWYVLDTAISLYFGVIFNVVFNTLLLLAVISPLIATKKHF